MTAQLGTIGRLADELMTAAISVTVDMVRTAHGCEYRGTAEAVDRLNNAVARLIEFQTSWRP